MPLRYDEWLPGPALKGIVTAYWQVLGDPEGVPNPAVLPDGHIELVFNRGAAVALAGPAFTGAQPARCVVGLLSHALRMEYRGRVDTFGIRLHSARGAAFLARSAETLADALLPLADVAPLLDAALASVVKEGWTPENPDDLAALEAALLDQTRRATPADEEIVAAVERLERDATSPEVSALADELGLSARQLQRRFVAAVGLAPKRFVRVLRFARVWQFATMQPVETWAKLAADHGFSDQAHMVREFRELGAEPPTKQFGPDWYGATELLRETGPAPGVRSVQDPEEPPPV